MRKPNSSLTTIWMAIAFTLACKELARYTGVAAADWGKELRRRAYQKLNKLSDERLLKYINDNFNLDEQA